MVQIKEMLAPVISTGARSGRKLSGFLGVTIHNTGNTGTGAGAINHARILQGSGRSKQASWHYAVDEGLITRSIPETEAAWHAADGTGPGNMQTVAIEICMNQDGDIRKATDNAAELAADILKRHGITSAADHLYQHNHWSGKNCPQMLRQGVPYNWQTFVDKVGQCLKGKQHSADYIKVQAKYSFEPATMDHLEAYRYADDLFRKMLLPPSQQNYEPKTVCYLLDYKYGKNIFTKLAGLEE